MPVDNNDVIRVSARQSGSSNQDIINVYHYLAEFATQQTDSAVLSAVLAHLDAAYTYLNAKIAAAFNPVDMKVDVVQLIGGKEEVVRNVGTILWTGTYNPSAAGDDLPPAVAALCKLLTLVGKTYARKFISGIMEADNVSGFITSALQTACVNFITAVIADKTISAGNILHPGVLSKKSLSFVRFVSGAVSAVAATQRRRKPYVGS